MMRGTMQRASAAYAVLLVLTLITPACADDIVVVKAGTLYTGSGQVIEGGMLILRDGRVSQVGQSLPVPKGALVIEVAAGSITPGLIDANAAIEADDTVMLSSPKSARAVLHDFFCPRHRHKAVVGCCGSTCSRALRHVEGGTCSECGFPNAKPPLAVGTKSWLSLAEHSSEVIPHTRVIDSVDLRARDFDRLLRGGVTTVFVAPDSAAVISSQGAIVRTGGSIDRRILRETDAVKATIGTEPSRRGIRNLMPWDPEVTFSTRRPTTRMGVGWVFRKAMYDTQGDAKGVAPYGADTPSEAAMKILRKVLTGEIALRIQARQRHDIATACRLADEFSIPFVLEEATEAHLCIDELKRREVPVIYGPIYISPTGHRSWSWEVDNARLHTMKALLDAGIETALTAHELRDEDGLARQAMYAIRYGVAADKVLSAVTATPAHILGIGDELGTLEPGKRGDVVLWSGQPFEATSSPLVVLIDGEIVLDRRKQG
ncbi:MAG: amidohydrolase family protein [Planctomycetes bacterium]|nr:amidohydrolase family protein [Planctomycetota bacterium]